MPSVERVLQGALNFNNVTIYYTLLSNSIPAAV